MEREVTWGYIAGQIIMWGNLVIKFITFIAMMVLGFLGVGIVINGAFPTNIVNVALAVFGFNVICEFLFGSWAGYFMDNVPFIRGVFFILGMLPENFGIMAAASGVGILVGSIFKMCIYGIAVGIILITLGAVVIKFYNIFATKLTGGK